jgi:large subunit ribosomal protein L38
VLYKQESQLKFDDLKVTEATNLSQRTFNTLEFYRQRQDDLTPAGLAFFQANWDESLTDFYHKVLAMKEPVYDYDYPEAYINDPITFPHRQPFNIYLDRYADPKEVNKRFLQEKLAKTHPFEGPEPPLRFPNAHFHGNEPSWLKTEIQKKRLGWGRINDVNK